MTKVAKAGCGAVGSARRSGRRGRKFESSHPDHKVTNNQLVTFFYEPIMNDHDGFRYITYHNSSYYLNKNISKNILYKSINQLFT